MKMKLMAKSIYNKVHLRPGCDKSEALCELLQRGINTNELHLLGKMGFQIEIKGDKKEYDREMNALELLK